MKSPIRKITALLFTLGLLATQLLPASPASATSAMPQTSPTISITPLLPDIENKLTNLQDAAVFAWQEFIALNWPAAQANGLVTTRDIPDTNAQFGDASYTTIAKPLVWHTYRSKAEIYPGSGTPPGYDVKAPFYGYDYFNQTAASTQYNYGITIGPANGKPTPLPWINLDENSEIGLDMMFAGVAPQSTPQTPIGNQIMFTAKANRAEYNYVAANQWWAMTVKGAKPDQKTAMANTAALLKTQQTDPRAGSNQYVSFPYGTIEIKAAWRQLTTAEMGTGRFYTTTARYYTMKGGQTAYVDATLGLVALHIIQKTPSAPHFIYASFSQADNLQAATGSGAVENENGALNPQPKGAAPLTPFNPPVSVTDATSATSIQTFHSKGSMIAPANQVYYMNTTGSPLPPGYTGLGKRAHDIPQAIIDVNAAAHQAIQAYNSTAVWQYYKLVNVQYEPYDKPAGTTYTGATGGPDPATYYMANEVVESDYNLQFFSGTFQKALTPPYAPTLLITDFTSTNGAFKNTYYNGKGYNMGGCMGCHGNAQVAGSGFSFIFKGSSVTNTGPNTEPQTVGNYTPGTAATKAAAASGLARFGKFFGSQSQ